MWGEAEGSVPSLRRRCRAEDFCQRAELWKWNIRMADHRGQRKMIFSSLRLPPPARAFVVGASAFNWKQVQAPPVLLQRPTRSHTYARTCAHARVRDGYSSRTGTFKRHIIFPFSKAWWQLVKVEAACKASLSAGSLSSPVSEDSWWPRGGVPLYVGGRWETEGHVAGMWAPHTHTILFSHSISSWKFKNLHPICVS